jgi:hypothetical protein
MTQGETLILKRKGDFMANNYDNIKLKLGLNQVFSATLHYQSKERKHRLAFDARIKVCLQPDHSLAEISSILVNELIERFNQLQHRSISWTHITLKFRTGYPYDSYRVNIQTNGGRLDGLTEGRCAMRFELQETGSTQTRWVNIFGAPKGFIVSSETAPGLNKVISEIESIILGKEIGTDKFALQVIPSFTSKSQTGIVSNPLSCNCRGVHIFPLVKREPKDKKRKVTPKTLSVVGRR